MLSFVGRGMCTSVSADQRSEALGARNAGECRLAQDGLEHDEAGAGVDDRQVALPKARYLPSPGLK